jgi:NAD-dependent deacetylase
MTGPLGAEIDRVARLLADAGRIVVLSGAGISTDSGIPDYRGPNGLWTKNPLAEKTSTLSHYLSDPSVRQFAWQTRVNSPAWAAEPNAGHLALVDLERKGNLHALVTQNIDELHQRAGSDPDKVVEVHGTMRRYHCWTCHDEGPMEVMLDRVRAGENDPSCLLCGGVVKSATISFGQSLVPEVIARALQAAEEADVLLAVGTSLKVYPVKNMIPRARAAGATVVIVNGEPTAMDHLAQHVLTGSASELLPAICGAESNRD